MKRFRRLLAPLLALFVALPGLYSVAQDNPAPAAVPTPPEVPSIPAIPAIPEPPQQPLIEKLARNAPRSKRDPEMVRIGQPVHVATHETLRSVVVIQSSATVDGVVEQDVVVIGGKARINGTVRGDVVNVGGGILLGPEARIRGDAIGVLGGVRLGTNAVIEGNAMGIGGGVQLAPGAKVDGETFDQRVPIPFGDWVGKDGFDLPPWIDATLRELLLKFRPLSFRVGWVWMVAGIFLSGYLLLALAAPGMVRSISTTLGQRGATAFLMGFLALPFGALITLFLLATGIGLIVVPFVGAAFLFAAFAGKSGLLHYLGCSAARRSGDDLHPLGGVLLGALIVTALYLVPFLGVVSWAVLSMWAIGAALLALLSRFRRETPPSPLRATPATPSRPTPAPTAAAAGGADTVALAVAAPLGTWTAPRSELHTPVPSMTETTSSPAADPMEGATDPSPTPPQTPPPMAAATPPASVRPPEALNLPRVALKERLLASALDWLLLLMLFQVIDQHGNRWRILVSLAYFAAFWTWRQTTLGGIVLRLKVARLDGRELDPATAIVRSLAALFGSLALGLGYFWSAWDPEKQGWHDKIAGTVVVRVPTTQPLV